jgi:hypothetical protein
VLVSASPVSGETVEFPNSSAGVDGPRGRR